MKISVCIPTYNGEKYIKEQLESILFQLEKNDEVIISDDSSTDQTIEILESFNDSRIKLYKNNTFKSPIFNLENALKKAKGKYVFLSDQDDIWSPNKIKIMLEQLKENDLIISDCRIIDENGIIIFPSFYSIIKPKKGFIGNLIKSSYLGCCMAFNRKILDYVLPFPNNIAMHDIWIGLNSSIIGKTKFIENKLIDYRRHGSNISPTSEKSKYSYLYKIKYRLEIIYQIMKRYLRKYYNN